MKKQLGILFSTLVIFSLISCNKEQQQSSDRIDNSDSSSLPILITSSLDDNTSSKKEEVGTSGIYSCAAFSAVTWPNCIFCRMDPGNATNDWAQKWSQTKNLNTDDAGNIFYVYNDASTDGAAKADGVWNLYLG